MKLPMILAGAVAFGLTQVAVAADKPASARLCYESTDIFPWVMLDRPGLNIIHLKAVEQKLGIKLELVSAPWKRCQEEMRAGVVDGIFAASFKTDRLEMGVYPMAGDKPDPARAMMHDAYSLYRLKGGALKWDGKALTASGPVGAQLGYSVIEQLKQLGAKVDDGAKTADDNLRKVIAGRVEAAALMTLEGDASLKGNPEFAEKIEKVVPPLVEKPFFLMLSKQFVAKYPEYANEIWKTVADVRDSADYKAKVLGFK